MMPLILTPKAASRSWVAYGRFLISSLLAVFLFNFVASIVITICCLQSKLNAQWDLQTFQAWKKPWEILLLVIFWVPFTSLSFIRTYVSNPAIFTYMIILSLTILPVRFFDLDFGRQSPYGSVPPRLPPIRINHLYLLPLDIPSASIEDFPSPVRCDPQDSPPRAPAQFVAGSRRPTHPRRPSSRGSLRKDVRESTPPLPATSSSQPTPSRPTPTIPNSKHEDIRHRKTSKKA